MPRIMIQDPWGMNYNIDTRKLSTLRAWLDEVLPIANAMLDEHDVPPANINVYPFILQEGPDADFDWLADTRVLGRLYPFPARTGADGLAALDDLRRQLETELAEMKAKERP